MNNTSGPNTKQIGQLGEDLAVKYLKKRGFSILERNYWKKWGEIDIIAQKGNILHFVEVKAVSHETINMFSQETNCFRPEENVHEAKIKRLYRTIETYLAEKNIDGDWQFDVLAVRIGIKDKRAKMSFIENIVL